MYANVFFTFVNFVLFDIAGEPDRKNRLAFCYRDLLHEENRDLFHEEMRGVPASQQRSPTPTPRTSGNQPQPSPGACWRFLSTAED